MELPKIVDLKKLKVFDMFNFTERCINLIVSDTGTALAEDDRFGIFFDNPNKIMSISDLYTERSFAEITDLTAQSYAGKNIAVCWSGGIDSSLVVAALFKNNIDFKVTVHERSRTENPDMYAWVLKNCNIIELDSETYFNNLYDHVSSGGALLSGDPADKLYPAIRYNLIPGVMTQKYLYNPETGYGDNFELLMQSYPDAYFYDNIKEVIEFRVNLIKDQFHLYEHFLPDVFNFIDTRLAMNNLKLDHFYQIQLLTKLIFNYNKTRQRLSRMVKNQFADHGRTPVEFEQYDFFDTLDYQAWAWTNKDRNFEQQSTNALTYKMDSKEYIVKVTRLQSQLDLFKIPSL